MRRLNENGAVAVLVAVMLALILVCVALVVDLGHIHNVKVQLQRAVDSAALSGANQIPDEDLALSAALTAAAGNEVDSITGIGGDDLPAWVSDGAFDVVLGTWDEEIVSGETAADRFADGGDPPNAVKVTATRQVDHVFFFFSDATEVTADAIAISHFEDETIPIALVSCIPTGGGSLNIGSPGVSICDIATYEFNSDQDDTAAWTALTFDPANKPNVEQFLTEEGRALFNEVIYGTDNPSHDGIENTTIDIIGIHGVPVPDYDPSDSTLGCSTNDETSINCGLGADISLDPESITDIRKVDSSKINTDGEDDPLDSYLVGLPRWYHFDDTPGSYDHVNDAFTRVWTQDGRLRGDQTELADLYFETTQPYGADDHRFTNFIGCQGACNNVDNRYDYTYTPNYNEALRYAGYPPVSVNNGDISTAMGTFIDRISNDDDSNTFVTSLSKDNEPFNSGNEGISGGSGYTVKLTLPVIFAGDCEEWKALSKTGNQHTLHYVGTANILVTRAWKNPNCFDQGSNPVVFSNESASEVDGECTTSSFDPALTADSEFACTGGPGSNPNVGLEGLIRPPTQGDESEVGIRRIYLVE